jgi:hypothetical protein
MIHDFRPGDFLIFQLESGYALLRVLDVEITGGDAVWHVAAYSDFFLDPDAADKALDDPELLAVDRSHIALTNHAFESTQVARLRNISLAEDDLKGYKAWNESQDRKVFDRSIRLVLGLR